MAQMHQMAQNSLLTQNAQLYASIVSRESMQLDTMMDRALTELDKSKDR